MSQGSRNTPRRKPVPGRRTPWFNAETTPPVHRGVYERDLTCLGYSGDVQRFAYWDGERWYGYAQNPAAAQRSYDSGFVSGSQATGLWRGLARKP